MKYKFNYRETYLIESFFDDLEDDLDNSDYIGNTLGHISDKVLLDNLSKLFIKCVDNITEHLLFELEKDILVISNSYYPIIIKDNIENFQNFLDELNNSYINGISFDNNVSIYKKNEKINLDFYDLTLYCNTIDISHVILNNINLEVDDTLELKYCSLINTKSISVKAEYLEIICCTGMLDFSFIKEIKTKCNIVINNRDDLPDTYNFIGLPELNYKLIIYFNYIENNKRGDYTITLEGIPDTIHKCYMKAKPLSGDISQFMNHFSLKGLTDTLIDKIQFDIYPFAKLFTLLIGPYIVTPSASVYGFTKLILKYVVKSGDYFMDCYKVDDKPNKIYDPTKALNLKAVLSAIKSIKSAENRKVKLLNEKDNILNAFKNLGFKYLKVGTKILTKWINGIVLKIDDKSINIKFINKYSDEIYNKDLPWENFIKWILERPYTFEGTDIEVRSVIIDPVIELKDKIKDGNNILVNDIDVLSKKLKLTEVIIFDRDDGTIGIIGNTYPIKDRIKLLGGRFSKELNYNGENKSGWYINSKYKNDIKEIINEYF